MEYLLRNAAPSTSSTGSGRRNEGEEEEEEKEGVERDEYGIALSSSTSPTEPARSSRELKIGGSTVSKFVLMPDQRLTTTLEEEEHQHPPPAIHPQQSTPSLLDQLHNLVLDHPHGQLELFLTHASLALQQPHELSTLINGYLNGYTAFHQACDIGDLKKVQMLCGVGVDRGLKDEMDGLTGIELAREAGRTEVVGFLSSL